MGKGGALNTWLKEFCALVFTQTLQAFIYAIVISMIISSFTHSEGITEQDGNMALGLMSVVALLSIFKVEALSRKIFGLGESSAYTGNAMRSIAKTAFALSLGKRVLNNVGKITGGAGAILQGRRDRKKLKGRLEEDMKDNGFERDSTGKLGYVGKSKQTANAGGAIGGAKTSGSSNVIDVNGNSDDADYDVRISNGNNAGTIAAADKRRMKNALRTYEDKMSEIKKAQRDGIKSMLSGIAESAMVPYGAAAGALLGGADGNLDEMFQGAVAGAGIGDAIGEATINTLDRATKFVQRNYKMDMGISNRNLKRSINDFKSAMNDLSVDHNSNNIDVGEI